MHLLPFGGQLSRHLCSIFNTTPILVRPSRPAVKEQIPQGYPLAMPRCSCVAYGSRDLQEHQHLLDVEYHETCVRVMQATRDQHRWFCSFPMKKTASCSIDKLGRAMDLPELGGGGDRDIIPCGPVRSHFPVPILRDYCPSVCIFPSLPWPPRSPALLQRRPSTMLFMKGEAALHKAGGSMGNSTVVRYSRCALL